MGRKQWFVVAGVALCSAAPAFAADPKTLTAASSDGATVFLYEYSPSQPRPAAAMLMFHQAGGDARGELGPIAEILAKQGRRVFTADLRSGGDRFGGVNQTAAAMTAPPSDYCSVYPDLEAALAKVHKIVEAPVLVVGSSYSAALVVKLAAEHPEKVAGFVSFSPAGGPPMAGCEPEPFLGAVRVPGAAIRNRGAGEPPAWIAESNRLWSEAGFPVTVIAADGHGASLLLPNRTKGDTKAVWQRFDAILKEVDSRLSASPQN